MAGFDKETFRVHLPYSSIPKKVIKVVAHELDKKDLRTENVEVCSNSELKTKFKNMNFNVNPPYESVLNVIYDNADLEGEWSWREKRDWKANSSYQKTIDDFHKNYHNVKKWKNIFQETTYSKKTRKNKPKHIFYPVHKITKEAQKRLEGIQPINDEIFRFRLQGKFRFYGFCFGNVFCALWHDPVHKIYPINE
jgi:hypothetical protein